MQTISLREANHHFSKLIAAVERGEAFCLTRRGHAVALLMPAQPASGIAATPRPTPKQTPLTSPSLSLNQRVQQLEARLAKLSSLSNSPE
ncbi:type II toxin-antitoxin system Phd/YefM family antitoxin [Polaromonas sp.]|uniref:type II toxin-antitoxin system Phd/YefM family antitoxin n=1 Tax=Polaromonas sp. TaxID=1869339 RepID=UPI002FC6826B